MVEVEAELRAHAVSDEMWRVQQATHFEPEDAERLLRRFRELCTTPEGLVAPATDAAANDEMQAALGGSIDRRTFGKVLRAVLQPGGEQGVPSAVFNDEVAAAIFRAADASGDGRLQFAELAAVRGCMQARAHVWRALGALVSPSP